MLAPPTSDSPAAGSAAASASSSPLSSLLKLPAWGPSSRATSPAARAAELPHSRYIPESERGWHGTGAGTSGSAASGNAASSSSSTTSRDRRRSSLALSRLPFFGGETRKASGSSTVSESDDDGGHDEDLAPVVPAVGLGRAVNGKGSLRSRTRSVPATPAREVFADPLAASTDAQETSSVIEHETPVEEDPPSPVHRRRRRRRSLQESSQSTVMYDDASTLRGGGSSIDEGPAAARPTAHLERADTASSSVLISEPPAVRDPRGYPWRHEPALLAESATAPGQATYVPTSHRNATGQQAIYDTHFGASSGWRSLSELAGPVLHPWNTLTGRRRSGAQAAPEERNEGAAAAAKSRGLLGTGTDKLRDILGGWPSLSSLSVFGPSSMASEGDELAPSSSHKGSKGAPAPAGVPYEPELMPVVKRDSRAKRYFDAVEGNVLCMGGYRGSILRDAESKQMLWIPIKVGVGLRRPTLELGLSQQAEDRAEELVVPGEMLPGMGRLIDMGGRLRATLAAGKRRPHVHSWGFDWRLSVTRSSRLLEQKLQQLWEESGPEGKRRGTVVVAHSMGGLVALHALARTKNPRIFQSLIFASTPFAGTANILGPFRYGDAALLNDSVCSPRATFSFRSSFALLPHDGRCFEDEEGRCYDLDFFDARVWDDLGLSPCVEAGRMKEWQARRAREQRRDSVAASDSEQTAVDGAELLSSEATLDGGRAAKARRGETAAGLGSDLQLKNPTSSATADAAAHAVDSAAGAGQALGQDAPGNDTSIMPANRQDDEQAQQAKAQELDAHLPSLASNDEVWDYLARTLNETRRLHEELAAGPDEALLAQGAYPPLAIMSSGRTPTVRGALVRARRDGSDAGAVSDGWKEDVRAGDYSRMLWEAGDGVISLRSSTALPHAWRALLVRGEGEHGEHVTGHRHVTLLSDVPGIGRCIEACRVAREEREQKTAGGSLGLY